MKTRTGRKKTRLERGREVLLGDRKTGASKVAFGTNMILTALCATGVIAVAANAQYEGKWTMNQVLAASAFGLMTWFQGSEVYRKTGTDYWWVYETGSKGLEMKKGAKK